MSAITTTRLTLGCIHCGHISCICAVKAKHLEHCRLRKAATCAVGIECEHGYDVCPICDPCTCSASPQPEKKT